MQSDENRSLPPFSRRLQISGRLQILGFNGRETFYQQDCFVKLSDEDDK